MACTIDHEPARRGVVRPGVEGFLKKRTPTGGRIGLVTNQTGITMAGVPTWRAMIDRGVGLSALFGPEHGFRGEAQDAVHVGDETFEGVKVFSLYGERFRPDREMIDGLDLVVFDIQDVGCRYYTYLQTLGYMMEACADAQIPFMVLDRPNPIGGVAVEGGPLAREHDSFVGAYGLPHRFGMTIGEFAFYLQRYYYLSADVTIFPVDGWSRNTFETPLPWVSPSPNIPTVDAAVIYPGSCLFEGTNLSEGRGTTRPFECFGAPWIDGEALRVEAGRLGLPGVVFSSLYFTPTFSKHRGEQCEGVTIHVVDRELFLPLLAGIALVKLVHDRYPEHFEWRRDWEREGMYFFDRLAGGPTIREMIDAGESLDRIYGAASEGREEFLQKRKDCLIYE